MYNVVQGPKVTWVDIQNPTEDDVKYLRRNYQFHPLVVDEIMPRSWRAKVEVFPHYLFLILYYPVYNKERKETRPRELDIIVTKDTIITSHYHSILPLKSLFDKCNLYPDARNYYMGQNAGYLLFYILTGFWKNVLTKLTRINKKLDQIEEGIFEGREKSMLQEISLAKADIIDFWRILAPQGDILESLRKEGAQFFGQDLEHYFADLIGEWGKAKNDLQNYRDTIQALEDTNNALLTNKTNEIVKLLTIFSVIVFPLTLLAAIFGMNTTYLPFVGSPDDFWVIAGIMFAGVFVMIGYFKKRKWI